MAEWSTLIQFNSGEYYGTVDDGLPPACAELQVSNLYIPPWGTVGIAECRTNAETTPSALFGCPSDTVIKRVVMSSLNGKYHNYPTRDGSTSFEPLPVHVEIGMKLWVGTDPWYGGDVWENWLPFWVTANHNDSNAQAFWTLDEWKTLTGPPYSNAGEWISAGLSGTRRIHVYAQARFSRFWGYTYEISSCRLDNVLITATDTPEPPPPPPPSRWGHFVSIAGMCVGVTIATNVSGSGKRAVTVWRHKSPGDFTPLTTMEHYQLIDIDSDAKFALLVIPPERLLFAYKRDGTVYVRTNDALGEEGKWSAETEADGSLVPEVASSGVSQNFAWKVR